MKARIALLGVCLVVACGDDGEDEGTAMSGVPDRAVEKLSEQDALLLCQWMAPRIAEAGDREVRCTQAAVGGSTTKEECESLRTSCLADPTSELLPTSCSADSITNFRLVCTAKASALETCLLDGVTQTQSLKQTLSCDRPGEGHQADNPASCGAITPDCFPI